MVKSVATFNTPKIITHVFVLMNFVSFLHIKAFITQIARKFPLSRMLRHVRLQWSFTFKSPITPIAREWNALVFWSNMIHVIFFLVISLFTFSTIKAEVARVNLHMSLQLILDNKLAASGTLCLPSHNIHVGGCMPLPEIILSSPTPLQVKNGHSVLKKLLV